MVTDIPAVLVLEDGRVMHGQAYGAVGTTFGEAVLSTGMSGYQETLTDPSYHRQVVIMTAPHVGNTGMNDEDAESTRIWVSGYVVRDPSRVASNWRATRGLEEQLADQGIVGISGIDTRALTRHLRERGAMRVGIFSGTDAEHTPADLLASVQASPEMSGADLTADVTTPEPYVVPAVGERRFTVVAVVTIGLAFATRQVIPALFAGVVTGSLVLFQMTGDWDDLNFISRFFLPALGTQSYAQILLIYLWCLGGLIGIWSATGAARHFAAQVGGRLSKSRESSL